MRAPLKDQGPDKDLELLREKLKAQRAAKADALSKVKKTTLRAVSCSLAPTTYLNPEELKRRLAEEEEMDTTVEQQ